MLYKLSNLENQKCNYKCALIRTALTHGTSWVGAATPLAPRVNVLPCPVKDV